MRKAEDVFKVAISLPIEKGMLLVDILLQSLNPGQSEIDGYGPSNQRRWSKVSVRTIPGEKVFGGVCLKIRSDQDTRFAMGECGAICWREN